MSSLTLEIVIPNEIITELPQNASRSVIRPDCSTWLNEQAHIQSATDLCSVVVLNARFGKRRTRK